MVHAQLIKPQVAGLHGNEEEEEMIEKGWRGQTPEGQMGEDRIE